MSNRNVTLYGYTPCSVLSAALTDPAPCSPSPSAPPPLQVFLSARHTVEDWCQVRLTNPLPGTGPWTPLTLSPPPPPPHAVPSAAEPTTRTNDKIIRIYYETYKHTSVIQLTSWTVLKRSLQNIVMGIVYNLVSGWWHHAGRERR